MLRYVKRIVAAIVLLAAIAGGAGLVYVHASGSKLLSVQSGSMVPALHKGDLVVVQRVPASQLAVGDVITFMNPRNNKQTITHRIVAIPHGSRSVVTKGDANKAQDGVIPLGSVIGKVSHHVPVLGTGVDLVRKPVGLVAIIYIPAALIIVDEIRRLNNYYKKRDHVYRLPGRKVPSQSQLASGAKVLAFCLISFVLIAAPVHAALQSSATLTGNTISTVVQQSNPASHIIISRVELECTLSSTPELDKLFTIALYNPTGTKLRVDGWSLRSREGTITTFRAHTSLFAHSNYPDEYRHFIGLHFSGDYIALFDDTGHLVDALSWGSDTTYFNPALPAAPGGLTVATYNRTDRTVDNDVATDWMQEVDFP